MADIEQSLERLKPECVRALDELRTSAWEGADPAILELCRLRVAGLLGDTAGLEQRSPQANLSEEVVAALADWSDSPLFDEAQRAHLAVAEQHATAVAGITQEDIDALLRHGDETEVYGFLAGLYVLEMESRLRMTARAMLETSEVPA